MEQPLVSILTVTRNRGNLLRRCISSVLSQTYKNIEHVVIDGASDDNTDEVVAKFNDERLRYVKLDYNWPILETSDYGIKLCKGKYITFLDSDDEYLPTKIEKQVQLMESLSPDYGMVFCWMIYYDNSTGKVIRYHKPTLRGFVPDDNIGTPIVSGTPTYLFRKEVLEGLGGWNKKCPIPSDWELAIRCCQICKIDFVPEILVNVYENHGSLRQTDEMNRQRGFYKKNVEYYAFILDEFEDNFKRRPRLKAPHYLRMAYYSFKDRNIYDSIKYGCKYINNKILGI